MTEQTQKTSFEILADKALKASNNAEKTKNAKNSVCNSLTAYILGAMLTNDKQRLNEIAKGFSAAKEAKGDFHKLRPLGTLARFIFDYVSGKEQIEIELKKGNGKEIVFNKAEFVTWFNENKDNAEKLLESPEKVPFSTMRTKIKALGAEPKSETILRIEAYAAEYGEDIEKVKEKCLNSAEYASKVLVAGAEFIERDKNQAQEEARNQYFENLKSNIASLAKNDAELFKKIVESVYDLQKEQTQNEKKQIHAAQNAA